MTRRDNEIDRRINALELLARKSKVIIEDLEQVYFGENINSMSDAWKIAGVYYETAGLKAGIVNDFLFEIIDQLEKLQVFVNEEQQCKPRGLERSTDNAI